jgi:SAM-dependent methyltransferase
MFRTPSFLSPIRFAFALKHFRDKPITILDVGCGNHSPSYTKKWFPASTYHGADIQRYNLDANDLAAMDQFFLLGWEIESYEAIPESSYDFIILNHVLEHTTIPDEIVRALCSKLRSGGVIWIAFPSPRSLEFPSGGTHTLNFCDDDTHIRVIDLKDVANDLLACNMRIARAGRSRSLPRFLIGAASLPWTFITGLFGRRYTGLLWYVLGFEDRVIGVKR